MTKEERLLLSQYFVNVSVRLEHEVIEASTDYQAFGTPRKYQQWLIRKHELMMFEKVYSDIVALLHFDSADNTD